MSMVQAGCKCTAREAHVHTNEMEAGISSFGARMDGWVRHWTPSLHVACAATHPFAARALQRSARLSS